MAISSDKKINLVRIAHVRYTHEDLDNARQFMLDFGLTVAEDRGDTVFYKGYGTEPFVYCATKGDENAFGGAAFVVESMEDLQLASESIPGATKVQVLDTPGGGHTVTFHDPVDGFPFHLVYGQEAAPVSKHLPELEYNFPQAKYRKVNKTQRFEQGPAPVHKLGHFGCCVTDFAKTLEFYTTRFNLKPSDLIHEGEEQREITAFLHLDRGPEQVDHHTFFFFEGEFSQIPDPDALPNFFEWQAQNFTYIILVSKFMISISSPLGINGYGTRTMSWHGGLDVTSWVPRSLTIGKGNAS